MLITVVEQSWDEHDMVAQRGDKNTKQVNKLHLQHKHYYEE